jgi:predicted GIY-YIG superfamily endonuclease
MDNANNTCKFSSSKQVEDIKVKLAKFQSMISHALEIEEDIRVIIRSLKERSIESTQLM